MNIHSNKSTVSDNYAYTDDGFTHISVDLYDAEMEQLLQGEKIPVFSKHGFIYELRYYPSSSPIIGAKISHLVDNARSEKPEELKVSWIATEDRLPNVDERVFITTSENDVTIATYTGTFWDTVDGKVFATDHILAWMPNIAPFRVSDEEAIERIKEHISVEGSVSARTKSAMELAIRKMESIDRIMRFLDSEEESETTSLSWKSDISAIRKKFGQIIYGEDVWSDMENSRISKKLKISEDSEQKKESSEDTKD